jgi:hypothetical protein
VSKILHCCRDLYTIMAAAGEGRRKDSNVVEHLLVAVPSFTLV